MAVLRPDRVPPGEAMFVQPSVVFEVRSPGDETYEKLPFYAAVGVDAGVVVERETKAVQVFARAGGNVVLAAPSATGWTLVEPLGIELRAESIDGAPVLHLRLQGRPDTDRTV